MYLDLLYKAIGLTDGNGYNGCELPMAYVVYDENMIYQITLETERNRFYDLVNILKVDTEHVMSPALCLVLKWLCVLFDKSIYSKINSSKVSYEDFIVQLKKFGFDPDYDSMNGRINYYR